MRMKNGHVDDGVAVSIQLKPPPEYSLKSAGRSGHWTAGLASYRQVKQTDVSCRVPSFLSAATRGHERES